jgi:hypothetical protein
MGGNPSRVIPNPCSNVPSGRPSRRPLKRRGLLRTNGSGLVAMGIWNRSTSPNLRGSPSPVANSGNGGGSGRVREEAPRPAHRAGGNRHENSPTLCTACQWFCRRTCDPRADYPALAPLRPDTHPPGTCASLDWVSSQAPIGAPDTGSSLALRSQAPPGNALRARLCLAARRWRPSESTVAAHTNCWLHARTTRGGASTALRSPGGAWERGLTGLLSPPLRTRTARLLTRCLVTRSR